MKIDLRKQYDNCHYKCYKGYIWNVEIEIMEIKSYGIWVATIEVLVSGDLHHFYDFSIDDLLNCLKIKLRDWVVK